MRTPSNLSTALIDDCLTALDNTAAFCEQGILRLNGFGKMLRVRRGLYGVAISCTDYTTGKLRLHSYLIYLTPILILLLRSCYTLVNTLVNTFVNTTLITLLFNLFDTFVNTTLTLYLI
jgi:hypothetical protein